MTGPVGRAYAELVQAGELKPDAAQQQAVLALDQLAATLRPLLPWLFVLFVFACIIKIATRD